MQNKFSWAALIALGLSAGPAMAGTLRLSMIVPDDNAVVTIQGVQTRAMGMYRTFVLNDERILQNTDYTFHVVVTAGTTKVEGVTKINSASINTTTDYRSAFEGTFNQTCEMGCVVREATDEELPLPDEFLTPTTPVGGKEISAKPGQIPQPEQGQPQQPVAPQLPTTPQQPTTPVKPEQGQQPTTPVVPEQGQPQQPVTPQMPPAQPQQPVTPAKPEQGQQPVAPAKPEQGQQPVAPAKPEQGQQPVAPVKPEQGQQPVSQGQVQQPEQGKQQPGLGQQPAKPEQGQQPAKPVKPEQGQPQAPVAPAPPSQPKKPAR